MAKRRNQKLAKDARLKAQKTPKTKTKFDGPGSFRAPKRKAAALAAGGTKRVKAARIFQGKSLEANQAQQPEKNVSKVARKPRTATKKEGHAFTISKTKSGKGAARVADLKSGGETRLKKSEIKARLRERKCVTKKNFGLVQEIVILWEKLRPTNVTTAQKSKLVRTVLQKAKGKIADLVKNHRASRVVQFCLKEGSQIERMLIMQEVKDSILDLSKDKYGRHLVLKLINYLPEDHIESLLKLFKGHIMTLLKHNYGSDVVADLYHNAPKQGKYSMLLECYGKELSLQQQVLFGTDEEEDPPENTESQKTLEDMFSSLDQIRKVSILRDLTHNLNYILEKGLVHPHLIHILMMEYLQNTTTALAQDLVHTISETGDGVMKMLHTREGAATASMVLAYGTSKVRKSVIRGFKDYVKDVAKDEWGHIVIVTMLGVVDDTALLNKIVVRELQSNLKDVCMSQYGSRVILKLVNPECKDYIPPDVMALATPKQRILKTSAAKNEAEQEDPEENSAEVEEKILGLSLKDDSTRLKSLLSDGQTSLTDDLLDLCLDNTQSLMKSQFGANLLFEVACGGKGPFESIVGDRYQEVQKAIVEECLKFSHPNPREDDSKAEEEDIKPSSTSDPSLDNEEENPLHEESISEDMGEDGDTVSNATSEDELEEIDEEVAVTEEELKRHDRNSSIATEKFEIFRSWNAQNIIARLIEQISRPKECLPAVEFASLLWKQVFKGRCSFYVGKPGEVILATVLSHSKESLHGEVKEELSALFGESLEDWKTKMTKIRECHRAHLQKKTKRRKKRKEPKAEN